MAKDNQPIPPRAMILSRKYRTLVSSWIEPLQEEAELGYEIDYIARYIEEGGLTGERKRWVPRRGKTPLDPDVTGFIYSNPMETSFKQRLEERLRKIIKGPDYSVPKPKAASKMVVSELKEELEAQGLPTDGTRNVDEELDELISHIKLEEGNTEFWKRRFLGEGLNDNYDEPVDVDVDEDELELVDELNDDDAIDVDVDVDVDVEDASKDGEDDGERVKEKEVQAKKPLQMIRVQLLKDSDQATTTSRRSKKKRSRMVEVDEELDELISHIKLEEGNTEFWKRRFLGEGLNDNYDEPVDVDVDVDVDELELVDELDDDAIDVDVDVEDASKDGEDDEADEEEEVEQTETVSQDGERVKEKEVQAKKPLQMIGVQLLKDSDQATNTSRGSKKKRSRMVEDIFEAFKELRKRKVFDVSDMYTIADAWGWTWERELKKKHPQRWSQEWEVELAIEVMQKACSCIS
ncbi:hypothetical protein EZV62_007441 [Acer yangbiense]|uniref:SAP domain-containing protein n=1 Tax=Acer yangbiense TaxID=1000413 RepID=A0A5C7ICL6_9ROSI|nr:hypothetical protein EZV62_007441 [Acer yangbiense]